MPPIADFLGVGTGEHFDGVVETGAEATLLFDAKHTTEEFLHLGGGIPCLVRLQAHVAAPTVVAGPLLTEVIEQSRATALAAFRKVGHLAHLTGGYPCRLGVTRLVEKFQVSN